MQLLSHYISKLFVLEIHGETFWFAISKVGIDP